MRKLLSLMSVLILINAFGCGGNKTTTVTGDDAGNLNDLTVGEEEIMEEIDIELKEDIDTLEAIIMDETADSNDCVALKDEELKKTCEQKFIYDKAVADKDKNMCGQLESTGDQEMCVAEIE